MKNRKIMRCASALLVMALMTTCAISGTFAKYVTSTSGGDSARVAYWGFDQSARLELDLFDTQYSNTVYDTLNHMDKNVTTVKSQNGDNVVAPGTSKSTPVTFHYLDNEKKSITAPEVDYKFTVAVDTYGNTIDLDSNKSFKWTLQLDEGFGAFEYDTLAELVKAIEGLSGAASGTKTYKAGTLPDAFNTENGKTIKIGWKWDYTLVPAVIDEGYDAESDTYYDIYENLTDAQIANQNSQDTAMGIAETLNNVNIKITITAEQVD